MERNDTIVIKADRVTRGDLIEVDGEKFVVGKIETLRNNMRFHPEDGSRPVLRGRKVKVKVTRDLAFYYRSAVLSGIQVALPYGEPFVLGQVSRVNR